MKSIFKVVNGKLIQKNIEDSDSIPIGWDLEVPKDFEFDNQQYDYQKQIDELSKAVEELANILNQKGGE